MKNRGFSLIELMVVIAIIMIMGAFVIGGIKGRMYKNEIIKMKTGIPTIINNATLRVYEKGISSASILVKSGKLSFSGVGLNNFSYDAKESMFEFGTSPAAMLNQITTVTALGAFESDFDIIVYNKGTSETALTFRINTKENLGVYNITTIQP